MHSIHMDNKYWEEPTLFRPERHIDKNGCVIQSDKLMPFGAGLLVLLQPPILYKLIFLVLILHVIFKASEVA